ncbi:MAG: membrane dipeptidase [candidate division WOR-3 bacterium]
MKLFVGIVKKVIFLISFKFLKYMRVFDLHQDLLYHILSNPNDIKILENYKNFGIEKFIFAIFPFRSFFSFYDVEEPLLFTLRGIEIAYDISNKFNLKIIRSFEDLEDGNIIIGIEGLYFVRSVYELRIIHRLGVRSIGLVWNKDNLICSYFNSKNDFGLTDLGFEIVENAINLKMAIDLAHSSDKTFFDVINHFKRNIFVSHTGIRELNNIKRNLSEDMIYEFSKINGIVGIAFGDIFLSNLNLKQVSEYIAKLVEKFPNTIAIGSDFFGVPKEHQIENLNEPSHFINLYNHLKNYLSDELIEKLFYKNAFEFFKRVLA